MKKSDLDIIASQLENPKGAKGVEMGAMMHATNIEMTKSAIAALSIENKDEVLEIGHGNAKHLKEIYSQANNLQYSGIDISDVMHKEAIKNAEAINAEAKFYLYNGGKFPFQEEFFNKIFTVNTIYFWKEPSSFLDEIYRVTRPKGIFTICYAQKDFMKRLPFVNEKFKLYNNEDIKDLLLKSKFLLEDIINKSEEVKSKTGEVVTRNYSVAILKKEMFSKE